MNTTKIEKKNVKMIAHRGLSSIETENTNSAFVAAGNRSYFGIETDVHKTADGRFVIFHDDCTERVALDCLVIEDTSYQTLTRLQLTDIDGMLGRRDLVIPDLADYINICKKYEKECVLELKNAFDPEDIKKIVDTIRNLDYLEHVIFISFALVNLQVLRSMLPRQRIQYLINEFDGNTIRTLIDNKLDLDIRYDAITPERVKALHAAGIEVNCWTVDDPKHAELLVEAGVDYITSNVLE
ncbi:MAG: glycerophosphodiester phosphodiesterase family protein [Candidatus Fimivivens sp.]|nr:glycerophosphodiester phosphodiesterase family protein [Candidatus Fimivivens sp.]